MPSYISAIRLRGFKSVGDREVLVDVPPGLVAVVGRYVYCKLAVKSDSNPTSFVLCYGTVTCQNMRLGALIHIHADTIYCMVEP